MLGTVQLHISIYLVLHNVWNVKAQTKLSVVERRSIWVDGERNCGYPESWAACVCGSKGVLPRNLVDSKALSVWEKKHTT